MPKLARAKALFTIRRITQLLHDATLQLLRARNFSEGPRARIEKRWLQAKPAFSSRRAISSPVS